MRILLCILTGDKYKFQKLKTALLIFVEVNHHIKDMFLNRSVPMHVWIEDEPMVGEYGSPKYIVIIP